MAPNSHLFLEMVICVTDSDRLTTSRHENKTLPVDYNDSIAFLEKVGKTCKEIHMYYIKYFTL